MTFKQIVVLTLVGSGVVVSIQAINESYFLPFSWFLFFQIIGGPTLTIILLPKNYWLRLNLLIITLTGMAGLIVVLFHIGELCVRELYLLGKDSIDLSDSYLYQGIISFLFLMVFFVWLFFDKRRQTKDDENKRFWEI